MGLIYIFYSFLEKSTNFSTSSYYRGATGIIIVYDITQSKTFDNIHKWLKEIDTFAESSTRKLLIGNKCDLADNRVVETEAGAVSHIHSKKKQFK